MCEIICIFLEYCKNNFLDISIAVGTIGSAYMAYRASNIALNIHKETEYKRDKLTEINKLENELNLLKGFSAEYNGINDGFNKVLNTISEMPVSKEKFFHSIHTNRDYLSFYEGNTNSLGLITNTDLRNSFVKFFIETRILFDCLEVHNQSLKRFEDARDQRPDNGQSTPKTEDIVDSAIFSMTHQLKQIKESAESANQTYLYTKKILTEEISKKEESLKNINK